MASPSAPSDPLPSAPSDPLPEASLAGPSCSMVPTLFFAGLQAVAKMRTRLASETGVRCTSGVWPESFLVISGRCQKGKSWTAGSTTVVDASPGVRARESLETANR